MPTLRIDTDYSMEDVEQLKAVSGELQSKLAALSPNGRRVRVPDSGHYIQIDQPDAVAEAIRQVFEAVGQ